MRSGNGNGNKCVTWQRTALAGAVAACFAANTVLANPTGPAVGQGQATFATQGTTLTVTNAPGTVINWQGFSIAGGEITRFIQQSQISAVLNRVSGVNPSTILGALQSNGRVFLVNPNGITIGPGANIDVAGFMASSLNLSDGDFLAGRMRFTTTPGAGSVVNQGTINTTSGGMVYLVGQDVQNSGIIRSPQGEIMLAAGKSVELVDAQTPEVRVQVTAPDSQAVNLGQLIAAGGRIGMYGTLVKHSGVANANTAVMGENGKIVFKAVQDVTLEAGSVTTANGPQGGSVMAQAETGTFLASGTIEAKGNAGTGGTVQLHGTQVGLIGNASVDTSGQSGGGTVLVGGDRHGDNPNVQNAWRTYFGADATVKADAIQTGDGGKVVVWADDITRFYGDISARGGAQNGNGGFAEVSGKEFLIYRGATDLSAPNGAFGTLLLDPRDITIQASGSEDSQLTATVPSGEVDGQILFGATTSDFTLTAATVSASSANVVLQAQRDININAAVTLQNDVDFVAQAGHDINVNAALTTNGVSASKGRIHLEADSPHSGTFFDGVGQVEIASPVNSCGGAAGGCAGGNITLIGGGNSSPNGGFEIGDTVQAGGGGINVALSQTTADLNFFIGAGGNTQLSSKDTGSLKTTGALVLGRATTAGDDGLGSSAETLTVNSITNATATPIQLSTDSGSSFELYAGSGGITLDRPLTTFQDTLIETNGTLTINQTLATSDNDLTVTAGSVVLGSSGSINIGSGLFTCNVVDCGPLGGSASSQFFWDGEAGDFSWFNPDNWNLSGGSNPNNVLPNLNSEVTIDTTGTFGTILIATGGTAQAKSLVAGRPIVLSSGALELVNASNFGDTLTFSGGTLQGTGSVVVSGPAGTLAWSGGSMASSTGTFFLGSGRSGTLSGTLSLNRFFQNDGTLTLSDATITGAGGSIANAGLITATGPSLNSNSIAVPLENFANTTLGTIQVNGALTTLNVTGANFPTNHGQIIVENGATFSTGAALTNTATSSLVIDAGNYTTTGVSVATDSSGNLAVSGALNAGSITLLAGGSGGVTLNALSSVTASTTSAASDSIIISGSRFTNSAEPSALDPGVGRFLVWSSNSSPFAGGTPDDRGSLAYDFKQYNATYGSNVLGTGNGFLYTLAPTITPTLQGTVTKTYDGLVAATLVAGDFKTSGIGEVDGDVLVLGNPATGAYASAHAGSGLTVTAGSASTLTSATDGSATVYGYQISSSPASGSVGTIDPRQLTSSATITSVDKTYDGLLAASTSTIAGSVTGLIAGDTVALNTAGMVLTYSDAHVVGAKTIAATGTSSFGAFVGTAAGDTLGGSAGNEVAGVLSDYALTQPTITNNNVAGTISAKTLSSSATITSVDKTYDGLLAASTSTIAGSVTGLIAGDTVALNTAGMVLTYSDAHVVGAKTIAATGSSAFGAFAGTGAGDTLGGSAGNEVAGVLSDYALTQPTITNNNVAGTISAKTLSSSATITSVDKTYDGLLAASTSTIAGSVTGLIAGDTVALNTAGMVLTYSDAHVVGAKTIAATGTSSFGAFVGTAAGDTLGGSAGNEVAGVLSDYTLVQPTITNNNVAGTINAAQLTATAATIGGTTTKTYDGNTTTLATLSGGSVSGEISGDTLTLDTSGVTLAYDNAHVLSVAKIGAMGAVSYTISSPTAGSLTTDYSFTAPVISDYVASNLITAKALTVGLTNTGVTKTYDATTTANFTPTFSVSGLVTGDTAASFTLTSKDYNSSQVLSADRVIVDGLAISGITGANSSGVSDYSLISTTASSAASSASITPAVVTLAGSRAYDSSTNFGPGAFGTVNGVNGETLIVASGTGTVASPKVLPGIQTLAPGSLLLGNGSGLKSNYTLVGGTHTGTITVSATVPFAWDLAAATDLRWENPVNWNQGAIPLNGAMANIPGGLSGPVVYSSVSGVTSLKTLSSASGLTITGGMLTLGNTIADISTFSGRPLTLNGGTLNGSGTISLVGTTLDVLAGGLLGGSRTIIGDVNNLAGTVSPGASPGIMTIDGNYAQGSSGTLLAEIGGLVPGTQYDQLIVTGTVTLSGNLNVTLGNGFIPSAGNTFTIIQSGSTVSGNFATTSLPSILPMQADLLASSVNVSTGASAPVNTDQLISIQINQINTSPPVENDMVKFIVITDPITNETVVTVGSIEMAVSGGEFRGKVKKPGVCR